MNLRRQRRRIYSPLRLTRLRYPSRIKFFLYKAEIGGDDGIRTRDLYTASVALSQLSYIPTCIMEPMTGFEPVTSSLPWKRSYQLSYIGLIKKWRGRRDLNPRSPA